MVSDGLALLSKDFRQRAEAAFRHLFGRLGGTKLEKQVTVFDDGFEDELDGASGDNWFYFLAGEDEVNGP